MPAMDFYIGTAPNALWIGSFEGGDAEPPCLQENVPFGNDLLQATDVVTYRAAFAALVEAIRANDIGWCATRSDGWPRSRGADSCRTDWVIQFHHDRVWITVGYAISPDDAASSPERTGPDRATTPAPLTSYLGDSDHDGRKDNRALSFTLLRDAVDAVTESDYPDSGFEEVIDDLRAAFDRYCALTDGRAAYTAAPAAD